jgi:hypothetical protein
MEWNVERVTADVERILRRRRNGDISELGAAGASFQTMGTKRVSPTAGSVLIVRRPRGSGRADHLPRERAHL